MEMHVTRPYHHWTTGDIRILRDHYPLGGVRECQIHLPSLSSKSIREQAAKQGIRFIAELRK